MGVPLCTLGNIAPGASASYTIEVSTDPMITGVLTNTAAVVLGSNIDLNPANNTDSVSNQLLYPEPMCTSPDPVSMVMWGVTAPTLCRSNVSISLEAVDVLAPAGELHLQAPVVNFAPIIWAQDGAVLTVNPLLVPVPPPPAR